MQSDAICTPLVPSFFQTGNKGVANSVCNYWSCDLVSLRRPVASVTVFPLLVRHLSSLVPQCLIMKLFFLTLQSRLAYGGVSIVVLRLLLGTFGS